MRYNQGMKNTWLHDHIIELYIILILTAVIVFLVAAVEAHGQTVKPAIPVPPPAITTRGQTGHPALAMPVPDKRLRRRFFDINGEVIATCDATPDRADHQRCELTPGRTIDDLLDTFDTPKPCADPSQSKASLRR